MKHVTASEARKNWFTLLDEAVAGEAIAIDRNGTKLVLRLEGKNKQKIPDYSKVIRFKDAENADKWGWKWSESKGLISVIKK